MYRKLTVLHGPPGCGKTTTALLLSNYIWSFKRGRTKWCDPSNFKRCYGSMHDKLTLYIFDNFLGHTNLDICENWTYVCQILSKTLEDTNVRILLVTRTSILNQALATTGADLADVLNKNTFVELSVNYQTMFRKMLTKAQEEPDYTAIPNIGFPVCCRLASSMPEKDRLEIFQHPRSTLRSHIKNLICDREAVLSLALLAVTEGYVNARLLRSPTSTGSFSYLCTLLAVEAGEVDEGTLTQIIDFYNDNPSLVQVDDDFVSFINEAVREEVLCVLCESHGHFLAQHCSLRLLCRLLALVTCDPEQAEGDGNKPVLPASARLLVLKRVVDEMKTGNYRDILPSGFFEHLFFPEGFQAEIVQEELKEVWLHASKTTRPDFPFWMCASKTLTNMFMPYLDNLSGNDIFLCLVGSCYWGCVDLLKKLLPEMIGNIRYSSPALNMMIHFNESNCPKLPCYPNDTLLTLAAWRGEDDVVKELVNVGADVNSKGHNNFTALMHYCARGNEKMVRFLLEKNAIVHWQDDIGNTALHYALLADLDPLPQQLLDNGATELMNRENKTPWLIACSRGAPRNVLETLRPRTCEDDLYRGLNEACQAGQREVVKYLFEVETEAEPLLGHEQDLDAIPLLLVALMHGKADKIVDILLPKLTYRQNCEDLQVLCTAYCGCRDESVVKALLPTVRSHLDMDAALRMACNMACRSTLQELLKYGPSGEVKINLLKETTSAGSWEFLQWAMATYDIPTTEDVIMGVISSAMHNRQTELIKAILTHRQSDAKSNAEYMNLAINSKLDSIVRWLIDNRRTVEDEGSDRFSIYLRDAIRLGNEKIVRCLLMNGARFRPVANVMSQYVTNTTGKQLTTAIQKSAPFLKEKDPS